MVFWKEFLKKHTGTFKHWIGLSRKQGEPWKWTNGKTFNSWWVSNVVGKIYSGCERNLTFLSCDTCLFTLKHTPEQPIIFLLSCEITQWNFPFYFHLYPILFFHCQALVISTHIVHSNSTILSISSQRTNTSCTFSNYLNLYKISLL